MTRYVLPDKKIFCIFLLSWQKGFKYKNITPDDTQDFHTTQNLLQLFYFVQAKSVIIHRFLFQYFCHKVSLSIICISYEKSMLEELRTMFWQCFSLLGCCPQYPPHHCCNNVRGSMNNEAKKICVLLVSELLPFASNLFCASLHPHTHNKKCCTHCFLNSSTIIVTLYNE